MSALAAVLEQAEALGISFRLEGGRIRFMNGERLPAALAAELWRRRAELRRVLEQWAAAEGRCHRCGHTREPGGGYDADGWTCRACLLTAGFGWALAPWVPLPDLRTAPLGRCWNCAFTAALTPDGHCSACLFSRAAP